MPLPTQDKAFLTEQFAALASTVKIDYFHQSPTSVEIPGRSPCRSCEATKEVLEELATFSDQITLKIYEFADEEELAEKRGIERPPGIVVRGEQNRPLRLTGMPGGVFLPLLTQAILSVAAGKPPDPGNKIKTMVKKLRTATDIRVIGGMMDPATGDAALAAWLCALLSDKVEVYVYNLDEFPMLGTNMGLNRAPATLIGGRRGFAGVTTPLELARFLYDLEAHPDEAELKPPVISNGSARPWAPPPPPGPQRPPGASPGPPGPPGPGGGPGRGPQPPKGGAPPGMHRTESGLVIPNS